MAIPTTNELIEKYTTIVTNLENIMDEQERYAEIEGAGNEGARTKFTDVDKIQKRIDKYSNKIANLRLRSDATV